LLITPESAPLPVLGLVFPLLAMFGSFLCCFNSSTTLAADEIWVQKKRVVSDAPEAWICGCCFMDFSLVCYLKSLPTLAGQGESETDKLKSFR
jgi:hypothetical protein